MDVKVQVDTYIASLPEQKQKDLRELHNIIQRISPASKLWFLDGKNEAGKIVSNPNIGYGHQILKYADGKSRGFYKIGLSANTAGISIYIMGLDDKNYLTNTYSKKLGKANVTGYCIKFKTLKDINLEILEAAIRDQFQLT